MNNIQDLYQEMIIDHSRNPHHFGVLLDHNYHAEGFNPLCGDKVTVYLKLTDDKIVDARFQGCGCAISTASASLMLDVLIGKTLNEAQHLFNDFKKMLTEEGFITSNNKLNILAGVRTFPMRVKCATLAWHTFQAALQNEVQLVSTE